MDIQLFRLDDAVLLTIAHEWFRLQAVSPFLGHGWQGII